MRQLTNPSDLDYELVKSVAWEGERCTLSDELREKIDKNREQFLKLIEDGVPCYGNSWPMPSLSAFSSMA